MKELFIKYFLKLMFLHENIMDKKVQYILLVFVGLWFVCCFTVVRKKSSKPAC